MSSRNFCIFDILRDYQLFYSKLSPTVWACAKNSTSMTIILSGEGILRKCVNFEATESKFWQSKLKTSMQLFYYKHWTILSTFLLEMIILNLVVFVRTSKCCHCHIWGLFGACVKIAILILIISSRKVDNFRNCQ